MSKRGFGDTIRLLKMDYSLRKMVMLCMILHPISHIIKDYNGFILPLSV